MIASAFCKAASSVTGLPSLSTVGQPPSKTFVVRSGTPTDIVEKLEDAIMRTAGNPVVREKIQGTGSYMSVLSGKEFGAEMAAESEKLAKLINALNLKND